MDEPVDDSVKIIKTTVILLLLSASLVGNCLLIFASAVVSGKRRNTFNAYIISMSAFGVLECSLTMSFAIGFSIEGAWIFGDFLMGFNCCFAQLQNIGVLLTITAMSADRYFVVCKKMGRGQTSIHHANYIVLYTWIHAFIVSLPLLFYNESGLKVRAFIERCLCGLAEGVTIAYTVVIIVTCIAIPAVITIICFVAVFLKLAKMQRGWKGLGTANYANYCLQESNTVNQAGHAKYVLVLFILFLIFKLPYLVMDIATQFGTLVSAVAIETTSSTAPSRKFYYQTAFVWMMFCFSSIYPLVTFAWFTEHKRRVRIYLCCGDHQILLKKAKSRKSVKRQTDAKSHATDGTVSTYATCSPSKALTNSEKHWCNRIRSVHKGLAVRGPNNEHITTDNSGQRKDFRVPILYATADGLHLLESSSKNCVVGKQDGMKEVKPAVSSDASDRIQEIVDTSGNELNECGKSATRRRPPMWLTLNPSELVKRMRNNTTQDCADPSAGCDGANIADPRSVSDKRVDVLGSNNGLRSEEDYFQYGSSFSEDEVESELGESLNSRTLILPELNLATRKRHFSRTHAISPLPLEKEGSGFLESTIVPGKISPESNDQRQSGVSRTQVQFYDPLLPNTPVPPFEREVGVLT